MGRRSEYPSAAVLAISSPARDKDQARDLHALDLYSEQEEAMLGSQESATVGMIVM